MAAGQHRQHARQETDVRAGEVLRVVRESHVKQQQQQNDGAGCSRGRRCLNVVVVVAGDGGCSWGEGVTGAVRVTGVA